MGLECLLADYLVIGGNKLLVSRQADLGVHHHLLVAGQADQHVRLEALAIRRSQADLGFILAALLQAGMLEHALEHQLAPVALGLLALQGAGQVGGFLAQAQVQLLQALQFPGQRETLTGLGLIALFHALLEGLDAFLERVEQLPQALLARLSKTLLAFIEDLPGQLGELCAQIVPRRLQVAQSLLVIVLLLAQLGGQRGMLGGQATQLGFLVGALGLPVLFGVAQACALLLAQLDFTAQRRRFGRHFSMPAAEALESLAIRLGPRGQPVLRQLRSRQALAQQGCLLFHLHPARLQAPGERRHGQQSGERT